MSLSASKFGWVIFSILSIGSSMVTANETNSLETSTPRASANSAVAAVPLPASLPLFLSAVAGFGLICPRRHKKA